MRAISLFIRKHLHDPLQDHVVDCTRTVYNKVDSKVLASAGTKEKEKSV